MEDISGSFWALRHAQFWPICQDFQPYFDMMALQSNGMVGSTTLDPIKM